MCWWCMRACVFHDCVNQVIYFAYCCDDGRDEEEGRDGGLGGVNKDIFNIFK